MQRKQKKARVGGKLIKREKLRGESELMVSLREARSKEAGLTENPTGTLFHSYLHTVYYSFFKTLDMWSYSNWHYRQKQFKYFPRGKV